MTSSRSLVMTGCFIFLLVVVQSSVMVRAATPSQGVVDRDYWPTDGWVTTSPEEQGMDSSLLVEMMDGIEDAGIAIDSVLISRHGYIVFEEYPRQYDNESSVIHIGSSQYRD